MKAPGKFIIVVFLFAISGHATAQEIWTIGPMLHFNFAEKRTVSFSIEAAYWNVKSFPYSFDFGIEFDKKAFRMYTEAQTGIGLTGISVGPVIEFRGGVGTRVGLQGSCWFNYILGIDYRVRLIDKKNIQVVGAYVKLPVATSGLEDGDGDGYDFDSWD